MTLSFDAAATQRRVDKFWQLPASFGTERNAYHNYLNELVSDRYALIRGLQILRDELQLAAQSPTAMNCGADLSLPSVVTTLAYTNCGDRIHQGEATKRYRDVVASRFATLSEIGELKLEAFFPAGGGTDNGATLAHVTVAHELDEQIKHQLYAGNPQSISLVAIDLKTHVGRLRDGDKYMVYGKTRESPWREPRAACGAIVGALSDYHPQNLIHRRIRDDLGEENFQYLSTNQILSDEGVDITMAIASVLVAIRGIRNTAIALSQELDERGLAHLTASTTVNRPSRDDLVIYLARATVFNGKVRIQSLGTEAHLYGGKLVKHAAESRLQIRYGDWDNENLPIEEIAYKVRDSGL